MGRGQNIPIQVTGILLVATGLSLAARSYAQTYPAKLIRFVVPFAAGSATDTVARLNGERITEASRQNVLVDNRPGASGIIAAEFVAKAASDGYIVLIGTNTTHAANISLFKKLPYDPVKDFTPVTEIGKAALVAVVHPSLPVKNVGDLTALARRNPGKLSFGSGSSSSLASVELYKMMAGVDILHVPYKSNPFAVVDLISGQISLMIADLSTTMPHVKAGKLRALAVTSTKRIRTAPELPTMHEAGVKGYELTVWFAAFLPAKAPADAVKRLNELFHIALKSDKLREYFVSIGGDVAPGSPEALAKLVGTETEKWARIAKTAGIQPE